MLFNSYEFIFIFLPIVLFGFHLIGKQGNHRIAIAWLVGASLFFYGWWNPAYLSLILFSILFNYALGIKLGLAKSQITLIVGVSANLALLGYYKYANFFIDNLSAITGTNITLYQVILPLAISFFTFQQITYLIDAYKGQTKEYSFLHYCLFVTFFPQLIAGPIVHHREMMPQFLKDTVYKLKSKHLAIGFTIFAIGLFKKVIIADNISLYSTPVFNAAEAGIMLTFFEAWTGAIAYSLQLYFDFSGYSDMAIGIARMFGIRLPLNFNSPYKSTSIIDFWRRWHITLSRFLRDYLYIPLGGNRKGESRRLGNIAITMLLGGLWHGAGWTFILWGGLHGIYLVINHLWRKIRKVVFGEKHAFRLFKSLGWFLTIVAIIVAWVPFRAESIEGAIHMLSAMSDINGFGDTQPKKVLIAIFLLIVTAILPPNTQQIMNRYKPAFETYKNEVKQSKYLWMQWKPNFIWSIIITSVFIVSILSLSEESEFLYFQF